MLDVQGTPFGSLSLYASLRRFLALHQLEPPRGAGHSPQGLQLHAAAVRHLPGGAVYLPVHYKLHYIYILHTFLQSAWMTFQCTDTFISTRPLCQLK